MYVAATTRCFPELSMDAAIERLVDLEFTGVELILSESGNQLKPSEVLANTDYAHRLCRKTRRLSVVALGVEIDAPDMDTYYKQFGAICRLAKAIKVFTVSVPSSELGTPFNEEVERLQKLVAIASAEEVRVGLLTETGCMSEDPDTAVVFCNSVKGLGLSLDPSHYIAGPHQGKPFDQVMEHVYHVRLRDTSKTQLQVRVGQGLVEYGRLVNQLSKVGYKWGLSVDIVAAEDTDQAAEMRKTRLLLESLL